MKKLFTSVMVILLVTMCSAQVSIDWQKTYGGTSNDRGTSIIETSLGNYIFGGTTQSVDGDVTVNNGAIDVWVGQVLQNQQLSWQKSLGGSGSDYCNGILFNAENEIVLAGGTYSNDGDVAVNNGGQDVWLVELDVIVNTPFLDRESSFGGTAIDYAFDAILTSDSGYVIVGGTNSNNADVSGNNGSYDMWVLKTNANHTLEWQICIGGANSESGYSIVASDDGGFLVIGNSTSNDNGILNNGSLDIIIAKIDANGNMVWLKNYGGLEAEYPGDLKNTNDGGYIFVGASESSEGDLSENNGERDVWIVKLNSSGDIEWQKSYGGSSREEANAVVQTIDGGYAIAGYTLSTDGIISGNNGLRDAWIIKVSNEGLLRWHKTLGGSATDDAYDIIQVLDGNYVLVGSTHSNDGDVSGNHGQEDVWIVKLDAQCASTTGTFTTTTSTITVNLPQGMNIQWMDCSNLTIIDGEINHEFSPPTNGDYSFIIADGTCKDTSGCINMFAVDINEIDNAKFKVFPNPSANWVQIETAFSIDKIEVFDINGRLIQVEHQTSFSTEDLQHGIYILKIKTPNGFSNVKLIKS